METCTYFSSIELKVREMVLTPKKYLHDTGKKSGKKRGAIQRSIQNPVQEMENNIGLKKYDKYRKIHAERVTFNPSNHQEN